MKTFLQAWLSAAPGVLKREISRDVELDPSDQLPSSSNGISLSVVVAGREAGRFTILVDREELHGLFSATMGMEAGAEAVETWTALLRQIAAAAAGSFGEVQIGSVEEATWIAGIPTAAYQVTAGATVMRTAFADEVRPSPEVVEVIEQGRAEPANGQAAAAYSRPGVDLLLDVELEASLRFGSREMSLHDVFELGPGDVVELDRHISEPVDLLVGDKIVARGEVVLVEGNFGFSVLQVAEPEKRLESIRCLF